MSAEAKDAVQHDHVDELYEEAGVWHVNTGGETIHAKRMAGQFRRFKWLAAASWLLFFFGPYLRWNDRQAILLDIPNRQFHIFNITIMPQDIWMLSLALLFFAILLAVITSIAGRVYCGYFCFQTIWTDVFTWFEDKIEGNPAQRRKLDKSPLNLNKLKLKVSKHAAWLLVSVLTGLSFAAWFTDALALWKGYLTLQAPTAAWIVLGLFTAGTYVLAGFMREQVCFWLCPYARIQGVMIDRETILPAYDSVRGEPRGKLKKGEHDPSRGDCIDCGQCVHVCPTGIDIRAGQQEGCITCGLCIDACDSVMEKIARPKGLIRYASLDELEGKAAIPLFRRPRVIVYIVILTLALMGILYGLTHLSGIELKVLHERQPLYVMLSDGSIENKYDLKILNKTDAILHVNVTVTNGPEGVVIEGAEKPLELRPGGVTKHTIYARVPPESLKNTSTPLDLHISAVEKPELATDYESAFFGPE